MNITINLWWVLGIIFIGFPLCGWFLMGCIFAGGPGPFIMFHVDLILKVFRKKSEKH